MGIVGGTGMFLAEKFESPTRCIESLAPPIGPRPVNPVQNLLERMACPAQTSIYVTKAATKGKPLLFLALRWIINPFSGFGLPPWPESGRRQDSLQLVETASNFRYIYSQK